MSAPLPLEGTNPYTGLYQDRQFFLGSPYAPIGSRRVFDSIENPPTAGVTAEGQTPLVEEAEFFDFSTQVITVTGSPTGGNFLFAYDGTPAGSVVAYNAAASAVQTSLRSLGGQLASVVVSGSAGGPWTVTGFPSGSPLQLIDVQQIELTGGTLPNVVVTTTAEQQGVTPF
jgi:hypothetical protein